MSYQLSAISSWLLAVGRERGKGRSKYGTLDRLAAGIDDLLGVMWLMRRSRLPDLIENRDALD